MLSLLKCFPRSSRRESEHKKKLISRENSTFDVDLCLCCEKTVPEFPHVPEELHVPVEKIVLLLPDIVQSSVLTDTRTHSRGLSRQFVYILAGDQENGDTLKDQVMGLGRLLEEHGVPYVIVMSSVEQPVIRLTRRQRERLPPITGDTGSLKRFVEKCYEKAKKILIAVSPGYLLYADAYVDGAQVSKTPQQQIIRDHHEKMKQEHNKSSSSTHRLWPVLLHEMNANRTHIPNFLQKVYFYWYGRNNEENVGVVLGEEFQNAPRMNE